MHKVTRSCCEARDRVAVVNAVKWGREIPLTVNPHASKQTVSRRLFSLLPNSIKAARHQTQRHGSGERRGGCTGGQKGRPTPKKRQEMN